MDVAKGYKISEIGIIPNEWSLIPICECTTYVDYRGKTPKKTSTGRFLVTSKNVKRGYIDYEISKEYVDEKEYSSIMQRGLPSVGDILITTEAPLGNVAIIDRDDIALAQRIIKYRANGNIINPSFLHHYFLSNTFQKILDENSSGTTAKGIKGSVLHKLLVIIPGKSEQAAIATALSDTDALINSLEKLIAKKRNIKQGAMQELFKPKKGWVVKRLGEIGKVFGGLSGKSKFDFVDGKFPYIPFMNIMNNPVIDVTYFDHVNIANGESQNRAMSGDLFFNGSSETPEEVGMCSVLMEDIPNLYLNSFCFGYRLKEKNSADGLFLSYFFRSNYGRSLFYSMAQGATRYNLSKSNFNKLEIALPKLSEQTQISEILSGMDAEIYALESKLFKYKQIKTGMMHNLLTGKIRLL